MRSHYLPARSFVRKASPTSKVFKRSSITNSKALVGIIYGEAFERVREALRYVFEL